MCGERIVIEDVVCRLEDDNVTNAIAGTVNGEYGHDPEEILQVASMGIRF